jgi:hypothetical protein
LPTMLAEGHDEVAHAVGTLRHFRQIRE